MGVRLSRRDLESVLTFVDEANSIPDLESFRSEILPGLRELVACDFIGYNEVDAGGDGSIVVGYPEPLDETSEALGRLAHEHPLIVLCSSGDLRTHKISDFMTSREFHRLEIYDEIFSRIGAEDQIAFGLPGEAVIGIAMNRPRRDFSERDRTLLDLLRPHLARAHARLVEQERNERLFEILEWGLTRENAAVISLDGDLNIEETSKGAPELLASWFPEDPPGSLPGRIAAWLSSSAGDRSAELKVEGEDGQLTVTTGQALDAGGPLLALEARPVATVERLQAIGLTRRQAEVLRLAALGRDTDEVAREMVISPATVRKHFENVYGRLGVNDRESAIAAAFRVA